MKDVNVFTSEIYQDVLALLRNIFSNNIDEEITNVSNTARYNGTYKSYAS